MKNFLIILLISLISFQVYGVELGFKSGIAQDYTGEMKLFSNSKVELESASMPFAIHLKTKDVRWSYVSYDQSAFIDTMGGVGRKTSSARLNTEAIFIEYLPKFYNFYFGVGVGWFQTTLDMDYSWFAEPGYALSFQAKSNDAIGYITTIGYQYDFKKSYLGIEFNRIFRETGFDSDVIWYDLGNVDTGGFMCSVSTGIYF